MTSYLFEVREDLLSSKFADVNKSNKFVKLSFFLIGPICLFLTLGTWAFASPLGATPDEDYHLVSIWCGQGFQKDMCEESNNPQNVLVSESLVQIANCYAFHPENSASCPVSNNAQFVETARSNIAGGYPKIFYWVMNLFVSKDIVTSVITMRLFNAILFTILFALSLKLFRHKYSFPLVWGFVISSVPLGLFLIPSVNPSSWAIMSSLLLWPSVSVFLNSSSRSTSYISGLVALIAAVLGIGARSDAAVYSCIAVVIATAFSWPSIYKQPIRVLLPASIVIGAGIIYLTSGQSAVVTSAPESINTNIKTVDLIFANLVALPSLWTGVLGTWGLGWLDTEMPALVSVGAIFVFCGMIFAGLRVSVKGKSFSLILLTLALVVIPLYVLVHDKVMVGSGVQPRYIFPLVIMFALVALSGINSTKPLFNKTQLSLVAAILAIANAVALHVNIRRYTTGNDVGGWNLNQNVEWWWNFGISPLLAVLVGALSFAVFVFWVVIISAQPTRKLNNSLDTEPYLLKKSS